MPAAQKRLVRTLVRSHSLRRREDRAGFDDFVRDKGKGLIGLLSGPPGVGKTLTAEAVAEVTRSPLYMLASGELGDEPSQLNASLKRVLELTQTWGAVLLLDEADVFLAERDDNLARNAIVSIFLRHLEYYQGILILTTNRVDTFDPAFESRIHFRHHYASLDYNARTSIWGEFVQRARKHAGINVTVDQEGINTLARYALNGRQVRLCFFNLWALPRSGAVWS
jgi:SpoVK/Ycf46/Vps4 family AAA+-type ATPase